MIECRYKTKIKDVQDKYKFKIFCYDATGTSISDFNANAAEKTQEFNDNAVEKTQEFNDNMNWIFNVLPKVTGEGETITLNDTSEAPMILNLKGNTQQDSTSISGGDEYDSPSPDHPQQIHTCSGDNTIEVEGKNLFDGEWEAGYLNINTGAEVANTNVRTKNYVRILPNTQYAISNNISHDTWACYYDRNKAFISNQKLKSGTSGTFTTPNDSNIYYVKWYDAASTGDTPRWQLEKGSTATTYEPYTSQSHLISLGDIELNKIGTYQDKIYKDNGKWYLHKEIGKVVLDGSESWTYDSSHTRFYATIYSTATMLRGQGLSNYYRYGNSVNSGCFDINVDKRTIYMFTPDGSITTSSAFKTWLGTNKPIIYYILNTPTNTEITDSTLLETLENIYSMTGTTNISQENNDLQFVISASALYDLNNLVPSSSLSSTATLNMNRLTNTNLQEAPLEVENTIEETSEE